MIPVKIVRSSETEEDTLTNNICKVLEDIPYSSAFGPELDSMYCALKDAGGASDLVALAEQEKFSSVNIESMLMLLKHKLLRSTDDASRDLTLATSISEMSSIAGAKYI